MSVLLANNLLPHYIVNSLLGRCIGSGTIIASSNTHSDIHSADTLCCLSMRSGYEQRAGVSRSAGSVNLARSVWQ